MLTERHIRELLRMVREMRHEQELQATAAKYDRGTLLRRLEALVDLTVDQSEELLSYGLSADKTK